jgi:hypothetical protein
MTYSLLLLLFLLLPAGYQAQRCSCRQAPTQEQTRWGNDNITLSTVTRVRVLNGSVTVGSDQPLVNALVEIFTDPDVILLPYSPTREERRGKQRRITSCFTDTKGRFCLAQLPPGRYELRCSARDFQTVSQTIKVVTNGSAKKHITVRLRVAT